MGQDHTFTMYERNMIGGNRVFSFFRKIHLKNVEIGVLYTIFDVAEKLGLPYEIFLHFDCGWKGYYSKDSQIQNDKNNTKRKKIKKKKIII